MLQKGLLYVTIGWCYNCWMALGMSNSYTWWQVDSAIVFYVIPYIQGLSRIYVHVSQAHGMRRIAHKTLPSFGSKRKW